MSMLDMSNSEYLMRALRMVSLQRKTWKSLKKCERSYQGCIDGGLDVGARDSEGAPPLQRFPGLPPCRLTPRSTPIVASRDTRQAHKHSGLFNWCNAAVTEHE